MGRDFRSSEDYHMEANKLEQEGKFMEAVFPILSAAFTSYNTV